MRSSTRAGLTAATLVMITAAVGACSSDGEPATGAVGSAGTSTGGAVDGAGSRGSASPDGGSPTPRTSRTPSAASVPTVAPTTLGPSPLGKAFRFVSDDGNGLRVAAMKIVDPARPIAPDLGPKAGNRLVTVHFIVENTGEHGLVDSPAFGSRVFDAKGRAYDVDSRGTAFTGAELLSVPVGESRSGHVMYEVPATAKITRIEYTPAITVRATAQWLVG